MRKIKINPTDLIIWEGERTLSSIICKAETCKDRLERAKRDNLSKGVIEILSAELEERERGVKAFEENSIFNWKRYIEVPVFEGPNPLCPHEQYIVYNGRRRVTAARKANIELIPVIVIENDQDIKYLYNHGEFIGGVLSGDLDMKFETHRAIIWDLARNGHEAYKLK